VNGALYIALSLILMLILTAAGSLLGGVVERSSRGQK
jgi:hypothetical protein